ncbi:MAG: MarR family winged helix-turn-helix transcriptional regulator [Gemmatimonadales bacterium]
MGDIKPDPIDDILRQWRRERPDLDLRALGLMGRLFRVVQLAEARLAPPLRALGLEAGWFDVLAALRRTPAPHELNPTELLRTVLLTSGGMTKRLDRLLDAGLIERRADPDDRRGTLVRLSRKGKALIDKAVAMHGENEAQILAALTAAERRELDRLLRKLNDELAN